MNLNKEILDTIEKEYGEAFYLLDSEQFEKNFKELLGAFQIYYPKTNIAYSYKTNYTPKLCKIVDNLGGYAEIVSDMEYEIAKRIGVKSEKVIFNGPYKKKEAIEELLLSGGTVNIDSEYEINLIQKTAKKNPKQILNVGIRCNFNIKDNVVSRFGIDVNSTLFQSTLKFIKETSNIHFMGLHCHFATRSLETWSDRVVGMADLVKDYLEIVPEHIDLGGGLFGKMKVSLKEQFDTHIPDYQEYAKDVAKKMADLFPTENKPQLFIEPGSAIVGDCMKFAAKVINIKKIRGKSIATLLGSIYNINPTLNKKNPPITVYSNKKERKIYKNLDFGGFTCIESDYLYRGFTGLLAKDDYIVFDNVGSYSIVLKPPFILPNFAILEYHNKNGTIELIKEAETFEDLFNTYQFDY